MSFEDSAYITLRNLHLDGRQRNVAGIVAEAGGDYAHNITLENLQIYDYDHQRGNTGITTRSPAWNWIIRNNHIHHVGTGMYLGQPDGGSPFIAGVIEDNLVEATLGYNIQIKHQSERKIIPGMPTGPMRTVIRYNTLSKAEHGEGASGARPNLLVGHFPPSGPGQYDQYLIYGNLFYENPHERLLQGEGNVALYNNLFVNRRGEDDGLGGDGVIFLPHNDVPKNTYVLRNTVLTTGTGIQIKEPDSSYEQIVAGNAIFSPQPIKLDGIAGEFNFTAQFAAAPEYLNAPMAERGELDLAPKTERLAKDVGLPRPRHKIPHLHRDYNLNERRQPTWGAF